jgi:rhodanese-related sulfurtransferase
MKDISRVELQAKIERGDNFKLVEALPETVFLESHIPGAVHLPPDQVHKLAPRVLPDKGEDIVIYGSRTTTRELESLGYTNMRVYLGGKADWVAAGLPTESDWDEAAPPP